MSIKGYGYTVTLASKSDGGWSNEAVAEFDFFEAHFEGDFNDVILVIFCYLTV